MPYPHADIAKTTQLMKQLRLDSLQRGSSYIGNHPGKFFGSGDEKTQIHCYQPGDDARLINWSATAKTGSPQINETATEDNLDIWVVLDLSPRVRLGSAHCTKKDVAVAGAVFLALLAQLNNKRLACVIVNGRQFQVLPPANARRQLVTLLRQIQAQQAEGTGSCDLDGALRMIQSAARQKNFVIVLSDFISPLNWEIQLARLARKHFVLALQITDIRDTALPNIGYVTVSDPATGTQIEVSTQRKKIRTEFAEAARIRQQELTNSFQKCHVEHLCISTEQDHLEVLLPYFSKGTR